MYLNATLLAQISVFIILALFWLNTAALPLFISALMVFPPVYLSVLEGIGRADRQLLEMAKVFRVPWGRRAAGIYLPAVAKDTFFGAIVTDGALPRKTFSMGEAADKRYYLEARRIS